MPLSEEQRQKLKELELKRGGVAFAREKTSVTPVPTVIISLGGLGAKTLNMLKGKFSRQIGSSNHVYYSPIYSQLVKSSADRKGDSRQWSTADTSDRTCDAGEQH